MLEQHAAERIHRVEDAYTNFYIVEDNGGVTIVDTGLPRSWGSLREALRALDHTFSDIEAVVLTHAHFDHMGFARRAHEELGVPLHAHEKETHLVKHPWGYDHEDSRLKYPLQHPGFVKVFATMGAYGALWVKGTDQVTTFGDSAVLDVPGRPHVVFTPGHTHGHCSLHFPDRGALIAGDAVVTFNPYTTRKGPRLVSGAATADVAQAGRSLDAIAATGAETVLTGHGEVWRDGAAAIAEQARENGAT
jgi:glyoxylase-like metal-dependent hydrolase (beta-lactamase superfamily II)